MSDSPDLTPEQDAVRRLLADARHDAPTPPEVVTRLDETLASLLADRATPPAPVVDLAARRRRWVGTGVLAAAAVVVAGVAIGQVLPIGQGSDDSSAESSAGGGSARDYSATEDDSSAGGDSSSSEMAPQSKSSSPAPLAAAPTLSSDDVDLDERLEGLRSLSAYRSSSPGAADALTDCSLPATGKGRRVAVEVDGQGGVVVFRRPDGASQDVAIYVCGDPEPVRTLTLPAP